MRNAEYTRRQFIAGLSASAAALALSSRVFGEEKHVNPNVLLITADDMDHGSLGVTGCKIPGISPNLDALAASGVRFEHAHVTSAICQPSRSVLMTGRYPHRNGAKGFEPIMEDVPTLGESLHKAGYLNGILSKVGHLTPHPKFCWDVVVLPEELSSGRDPGLYYKHTKSFLEQAKAAGKPFFLMANSQDPHRPFPGSEKGTALARAARQYRPEEVEVPAFLPDGVPNIRKEVAQYFSAVHRCDETVGQILRGLKEIGFEDNTIVIFLSDNGMAFPFAKTNCYEASTRTPLIVRWPDRIKAGTINRGDMVSGIDLMPTVLDALELERVEGLDGHSFLPLLKGKEQDGWDKVFTFITSTAGRGDFPMRGVRTTKRSYIFNAWSDGKTEFRNESQGGLTWKAMLEAAEKDRKIAERVKLFRYRVPEEFYDLEEDPSELNNLIASPEHKGEIGKLRAAMLRMMESTKDPLLEAFKKRTRASS